MRFRGFIIILISFVCSGVSFAQSSVFPLGGRRGTTFEVELRGVGDAKDVWFDCGKLKAEFRKEKDEQGPRVIMKVEAAADIEPGAHCFQLTTGGGVLNQSTLMITDLSPILETEASHHKPGQAQQVAFPAAVHGRISKAGERDYYTIRIAAGDEIQFEVITGCGLLLNGPRLLHEPTLALYDPVGSWFDPQRPRRINANDESHVIHYSLPHLPAMRYPISMPRLSQRFEKEGWVIIEVGEINGAGSPDMGYLLRVEAVRRASPGEALPWTPRVLAHGDPLEWRERDFGRRIENGWLKKIWSRTLKEAVTSDDASAKDKPKDEAKSAADFKEMILATSNAEPPRLESMEPNNDTTHAQQAKCPALIEGTIDKPGDVDFYRFSARAGQPVVFEMRTPDLSFLNFHLRMDVLDAEGKECCANIYRKVSGDGDDWVKSIEAKVSWQFPKSGDYYLRVQELTLGHGGPKYTYQILMRPPIPHVGEVAAVSIGGRGTRYPEEKINLARGKAKKITVVSEHEEGFKGEVAIQFENLPPGVRALPALAEEPDVSAVGQVYEFRGVMNKEWYRPDRHVDTIMLYAAEDTSPTAKAQWVQLTALPIVEGKPGAPILAQRIPLMVMP